MAVNHKTLIGFMEVNPFYILFTAYRTAIYGIELADGGSLPPAVPDLAGLGILFLVSIGLTLVATVFFKRIEPTVAKVL